MKKTGFAIWVLMIVPCLAQEAVVLRTGEVTADKLWVGAFAQVVYLGDRGERMRVKGYINDVGRNTFIIGTGLKKEQVYFQKALLIVLGDNRRVVERQGLMLNKQLGDPEGQIDPSTVASQLLLGVGGCALGGFFGAMVGASVNGRDTDGEAALLDRLQGLAIGGGAGVVLGSTIGVALAGRSSFERPPWGRALAGSLIGLGAGVALASETSLGALFIAPPVCATMLSWVGNSPKRKRVSFNVGLMQHGGQGVKATYHF